MNPFNADFTHKTKISSSNHKYNTSVPGSIKQSSSKFESRKQSQSLSPRAASVLAEEQKRRQALDAQQFSNQDLTKNAGGLQGGAIPISRRITINDLAKSQSEMVIPFNNEENGGSETGVDCHTYQSRQRQYTLNTQKSVISTGVEGVKFDPAAYLEQHNLAKQLKKGRSSILQISKSGADTLRSPKDKKRPESIISKDGREQHRFYLQSMDNDDGVIQKVGTTASGKQTRAVTKQKALETKNGASLRCGSVITVSMDSEIGYGQP